MPNNRQQDSVQLNSLYLPYNRLLAPHDLEPRLVGGENMVVTAGGKLSRRPALLELPGAGLNRRIDRLCGLETNPITGINQIYIGASTYYAAADRWQFRYIRPPNSFSTVSGLYPGSLDASTKAHEMLSHNGKMYIRSIPHSSSADKYGTTKFDPANGGGFYFLWGLPNPTSPATIRGQVRKLSVVLTSTATSLTLASAFTSLSLPFLIQIDYELILVNGQSGGTLSSLTRGYNGTEASSHSSGSLVVYRDWAASDHAVSINYGKKYSYCYKGVDGHLSVRAPIETNPDKPPSATGPFQDLVPRLNIPGHTDTANIPKVVVLSTTDGGGTFYKLSEATNNGGTIDYSDNTLESGASGGTFNDLVPDDVLSRRDFAPTLTSNAPPPGVVFPSVVGVDTPVAGTAIASYAGRLWYGIQSHLFFSQNEELPLNSGIPEDSFQSGGQGSYKLNNNISYLIPTKNGLCVITSRDVLFLTGTTRETFNLRPLHLNLGGSLTHKHAFTVFGNKVIFLTSDYRVALLDIDNNPAPKIISEPLYTDIVDLLNAGAECEIAYFGDLEKSWIVVACHNRTNPAFSRQFVYDIELSAKTQRDFWFVPWTIPSTAMLSFRVSENSERYRLMFACWSPTESYGRIMYIDPTYQTNFDAAVGTSTTPGASAINFSAITGQHMLPPGNHANSLRIPGMSPVVDTLRLERVMYAGDEDPNIHYYIDDLWLDPKPGYETHDAPRIELPTGYKTIDVSIGRVCQRFAFRIGLRNSVAPFDLLGYSVIYTPEEGA